MNPTLPYPAASATEPRWATPWRDAWRGDRTLMVFASLLIALLVPMAFGLLLDDRTLRGVNAWVKPMKFALSLAVLAATTAYFASWVDASRRRGLAFVRWTLIGAATFEMAYIGLQAALGQASHYNVGDPLHRTLYTMMGVGAVLLTGTQGVLAWRVARGARPGLHPTLRLAGVVGLTYAFVLGTVSGMPLANLQPPDASVLPVLGWHLVGDLRPAHFVGLHAEQALPLVAVWAVARRPAQGRAVVIGAAVAWLGVFVALMALGLAPRLMD